MRDFEPKVWLGFGLRPSESCKQKMPSAQRATLNIERAKLPGEESNSRSTPNAFVATLLRNPSEQASKHWLCGYAHGGVERISRGDRWHTSVMSTCRPS